MGQLVSAKTVTSWKGHGTAICAILAHLIILVFSAIALGFSSQAKNAPNNYFNEAVGDFGNVAIPIPVVTIVLTAGSLFVAFVDLRFGLFMGRDWVITTNIVFLILWAVYLAYSLLALYNHDRYHLYPYPFIWTLVVLATAYFLCIFGCVIGRWPKEQQSLSAIGEESQRQSLKRHRFRFASKSTIQNWTSKIPTYCVIALQYTIMIASFITIIVSGFNFGGFDRLTNDPFSWALTGLTIGSLTIAGTMGSLIMAAVLIMPKCWVGMLSIAYLGMWTFNLVICLRFRRDLHTSSLIVLAMTILIVGTSAFLLIFCCVVKGVSVYKNRNNRRSAGRVQYPQPTDEALTVEMDRNLSRTTPIHAETVQPPPPVASYANSTVSTLPTYFPYKLPDYQR